MNLHKTIRVVKLPVLLLITTFLLLNNKSYSQITLRLHQVPFEQVAAIIEKQSGYVFVYNENKVKIGKVDVDAQNATVEIVLRQCLKNYPIVYKIVGKNIVLQPAPMVEKAEVSNISQVQQKVLHGYVADSAGHPMQNVNIVNISKGRTKTYTLTDAHGEFDIAAETGDRIIFSYVGYQPQTFTVDQRLNINIFMRQLTRELDSVSVGLINTGYQFIKPEQSTGAVSRIDTKEYESQMSSNFLEGLTNKLPGLMINPNITFTQKLPNGTTTTNSLFQIRGLSTISGNQNPLIVVDGYPTELTLDMINPNEIKSVTVLKDAAAATIYGVRASNGVIVIERKQAELGKTQFAFRTTLGITPRENYSRYRWAKDGSNTVINYDRNIYSSTPSTDWGNIIAQSPGAAIYSGVLPYYIIAQNAAGMLSSAQEDSLFTQLGSYNNAADYDRLFLRSAITQTYNLDMSGGNQNALYYITANYTGNTIGQKNNSNRQVMLSARTTLNFTKRFSLELTTDYQEEFANSAPIPDINTVFPYEHFTDAFGNPTAIHAESGVSPYYNNYLMSIGLLNNLYYPLVDMKLVDDKTHTLSSRVTANFNYKIGSGFSLMFGGVYENATTDISNLANAGSSTANQAINHYAQQGTTGLIFNIPKGGYLQKTNAFSRTYTLRAQLNYNKHIGKNHSINAILGTEVRDVTDQTSTATYFGYSDETLVQQPVNYGTLFNGGFNSTYTTSGALSYNNLFNQLYTDDRYVSGYSNIVYAFRNTYSLTGSARIDQSNLFGTNPKYRYKPLWSVGAAWNISHEKFMENAAWIDILKLRIAYGFNGNVAKDVLPQVIAQNKLSTLYPGTNTLALFSYANSGLRWEQTQNFNVGLDYSIFKRINGSVDYYNKKSTDLLSNGAIDPSHGAVSAQINTASMNNKGLEVSLHADWIVKKGFNWNTGLIFANNTSKVLEVYNTSLTPQTSSYFYISGINSNYLKGYPVGAMFSYRYAGLDSTGWPLIYDSNGKTHQIVHVDSAFHDLKYSGSSIPSRNIGFSNRIDVGNFYFYCMINYYGGFKVRVPVPLVSATRPLPGANNYWMQPGDEKKPGIMPSLQFQQLYSAYMAAFDSYTVNGDYFTLGDITVSYNIGGFAPLKKAGFTHFEIKLQATNLYTVALNKYNYSMATGSYYKPYVTPTYTIGLFTNF